MLVLSRKPGQSIIVGDARLTVRAINQNRVELVFEAPRSVRIVRGELELVERAAAVGKLDVAERMLDAGEGQS